MRTFLLILFGCMALSLTWGQQAATRWVIGNGYGLDFSTQPPTVDSANYQATSPHISSICDKAGNLLFYTDGAFAWNASHQLISTTRMAEDDPEWVLIVPQPQSSRYYIFTAQTANGFSKAQYAVIDMAANGGQGAIVEPLQVLRTDIGQDWNISAQGFCNGSLYWIVLSNPGYVNQTGTVILRSYRLDSQGLDIVPVVSYPGQTVGFQMVNALAMRFSPSGLKVAFRATGIVSADFNPLTGEFSHFERVDPVTTAYFLEFSPNGRYLYGVEVKGSVGTPGDSLYSTLAQYDMQAGSPAAIFASRVLLHLGKPLAAPQTGPDGKIYLLKTRSDLFQPSFSIIQQPDLPGTSCNFVLDALPLPSRFPNTYSVWVPMLPNNLIHNFARVFPTDFAGPDQVVCPGETAPLGTTLPASYAYEWKPGDFLSQPQSSQTGFNYPFDLYQDSSFSYILGAQVDYCYLEDTVVVTVKKKPLPPVMEGLKAVCPGSEGVVYQVINPQDSVSYFWTTGGGTLVSGQGTSRIEVDWGNVSGTGYVRVVPSFINGCEGDPVDFPVQISTLLEPGLPYGPSEICVEKKDNLLYSIAGAPGSSYTWHVSGGAITGQPAPGQVSVSWTGTGLHEIWAEVAITTSDTVCAGISDTLQVEVFSDSGYVELLFATTLVSDEHLIQLFCFPRKVRSALDSITIWRREPGSVWAEAGKMDIRGITFNDPALQTDDTPYEYQVTTGNVCRSPIFSDIHRSVLLTAVSDTVAEEVRLEWTPYLGWPVKYYQLLDKPSGAADYVVINTFLPDVTSTVLKIGNAGAEHQYRILAQSADVWGSLSNEVEAYFRDDIFIPNVFTPNGDGISDRWIIKRLNYYPDNILHVYDRWGRLIFEVNNYRNNWSGSALAEGVYYYVLTLGPGLPVYKGSVTLLR